MKLRGHTDNIRALLLDSTGRWVAWNLQLFDKAIVSIFAKLQIDFGLFHLQIFILAFLFPFFRVGAKHFVLTSCCIYIIIFLVISIHALDWIFHICIHAYVIQVRTMFQPYLILLFSSVALAAILVWSQIALQEAFPYGFCYQFEWPFIVKCYLVYYFLSFSCPPCLCSLVGPSECTPCIHGLPPPTRFFLILFFIFFYFLYLSGKKSFLWVLFCMAWLEIYVFIVSCYVCLNGCFHVFVPMYVGVCMYIYYGLSLNPIINISFKLAFDFLHWYTYYYCCCWWDYR